MITIGNNATTSDGLPVERVNIFYWSTGELIESVIPGNTGDWTANILEDVIGVTYLAQTKTPQTHGPYDLIPANAVLYGTETVWFGTDIVLGN